MGAERVVAHIQTFVCVCIVCVEGEGLGVFGGCTMYIQPVFLFYFCSVMLPEYPNCLQTTLASSLSQLSSHTVPQMLAKQISTLPSNSFEPLTRRTSPFSHTKSGERN